MDLQALFDADPIDADARSRGGRYAVPFRAPVKFRDIDRTTYHRCFACEFITDASPNSTPEYRAMIKLYCDNSTSRTKDAVFALVKQYFDEVIKPEVAPVDWTIESIREHFTKHTNYATDEVLSQLSVMGTIRGALLDTIAFRDESGFTRVDVKVVKTLIVLQREIRELRKSREKLPQMLGYNENLKY
jgi:hypothetical protein